MERLARSTLVRLILPALFLAAHLLVLGALAQERFGRAFNSAPGREPSFAHPATDAVPAHWQRLIVSRWDSQHYITLALRGYEYCAPREALGPERPPDSDVVCQLNFFPGYALLGAGLRWLTGAPVDYALFAIALLASYLLMFLWTSKEMQSALGTANTYLSLLLLNTFTTGYSFVALQTESCALFFAIAAFVALERRHFALGAACAGAASLVRPTGVAIGLAFALALVVVSWRERARIRTWLWRGTLMLVSGWGVIGFLSFCYLRFGDALIYSHARTRYYQYAPDPLALLTPKYTWISQSIWAAPNEGVWLAAGLVFFALGHRRALAGFRPHVRVYWYAVFVLAVGIAASGQVTIGFSGMSRYLLLALPLFFATAAVLRRRPLALALWVVFSCIHYWSVNACFYIGKGEPDFWRICHCQPGA